MVQLEVYCFGCSLKTRSLTLLWLTAITECLSVKTNLEKLLSIVENCDDLDKFDIILNLYYQFSAMVGGIVSILGVYGIQKNVPEYLNYSFYFICYYAIYYFAAAITLVYSSPWFHKIFSFSTSAELKENPKCFRNLMVIVMIIAMVIEIYFALILKSCRDFMMKINRSKAKLHNWSALGYHKRSLIV